MKTENTNGKPKAKAGSSAASCSASFNGGDIIKEEWCFHGFGGGGNFPWDVQEYVGPPVFRLHKYHGQSFSIENVNRLGWPVSRYKVTAISKEESEALQKKSKYDEYYKCWRENK